MNIHLIRHAESNKLDKTCEDKDRSLSIKGISQSINLAKYCQNSSFRPERTFCSSSQRTKETCEYLLQSCSLGEIEYSEMLYLASLRDLLNFIWSQNHGQDLLLVGHNEGLSELASYFAGESIHLKTASFVTVQFEFDNWIMTSQNTGVVRSNYRPLITNIFQ